tara:strand:- start:280 stop:672 length:393 start_codon:yes stop_codon:yes gene_type:complete
MASELKVNKLTGVTTAGSISVTGEGNSTTTNLQQGLAKVWVQGTDSATFSDSFNISSGTDNGTGDYRYTFSSSMGNNNYSQTTNAKQAEISQVANRTLQTTYIEIQVFSRADSFAAADQTNFNVVHGDLA